MASKKALASDNTVKAQLAQLSLDNVRLHEENQRLTDENEAFRKQNVELASVIENDLKGQLITIIQARSKYTDSDLEVLSLEQLQAIDETLSMGKGVDSTFKPIRVGRDSADSNRLTVGSTYGKTRDQILAME
jgi:hypothetical protein